MIEYTTKTKNGTVLRRSIRVDEIRAVFENDDHTASLRVSEIRKTAISHMLIR